MRASTVRLRSDVTPPQLTGRRFGFGAEIFLFREKVFLLPKIKGRFSPSEFRPGGHVKEGRRTRLYFHRESSARWWLSLGSSKSLSCKAWNNMHGLRPDIGPHRGKWGGATTMMYCQYYHDHV